MVFDPPEKSSNGAAVGADVNSIPPSFLSFPTLSTIGSNDDDNECTSDAAGVKTVSDSSGLDATLEEVKAAKYLEQNRVEEAIEYELPGKKKLLSLFQSSSVLVNYISIGYILLPAAFASGGMYWTTVCLTFVSLQSYISGIFVLESCARAEALENVDETVETASRHSEESIPPRRYVAVKNFKFELSELSRYFMGRKLRNFFTVTTVCDLFGLTWALSAVFGSALADTIPISGNSETDYKYYVLIFMGITVPMSCIGISDQVVVQMIFLTARMVMVAMMIVTTAVAYNSDVPHFGTQIGPANNAYSVNLSETVSTLILCVFSTAFQFSVPSLTNETENKEQMKPIMKSAVTYVLFSNVILGLVLAMFFGLNINESSNLNWVDYHGGTWNGDGDAQEGRSGWSAFISHYIVLFAAIDGLAVYPLVAISLGEIMMSTVYEERIHSIQNDWKIRTTFRLLACVPQGIGSLFIYDLGVIAKYTGIFTLLSYTICPSLLNIYGRRRMEEVGLTEDTYYKTVFSAIWCSWTFIGISSLLIVGVIVEAFI